MKLPLFSLNAIWSDSEIRSKEGTPLRSVPKCYTVKAVILVFLKINPKRAEYVGGLIIYVNLKLITMEVQTTDLTDLTDYIDISWYMLCEDYNINSGDISPCQQSRVDDAVEEIHKVLIEFVKQNGRKTT